MNGTIWKPDDLSVFKGFWTFLIGYSENGWNTKQNMSENDFQDLAPIPNKSHLKTRQIWILNSLPQPPFYWPFKIQACPVIRSPVFSVELICEARTESFVSKNANLGRYLVSGMANWFPFLTTRLKQK